MFEDEKLYNAYDSLDSTLLDIEFKVDTIFYKKGKPEKVLEFEKISFIFKDYKLILTPLPDYDEVGIKVEHRKSNIKPNMNLKLKEFQFLIGKKLDIFWICNNHQGYRDLVILGFEDLLPKIVILCMGSALRVFNLNLILQEAIEPKKKRKKLK